MVEQSEKDVVLKETVQQGSGSSGASYMLLLNTDILLTFAQWPIMRNASDMLGQVGV